MSAVDDYCKEINLHVRHVAQLLVAWYTFFVTANLIAVGWFMTADQSRARLARPLLWVLVILFVLVNLLGVLAMRFIRRYLIAADSQLLDLLQSEPISGEDTRIERSPIPLTLYLQMLRIIAVSLLAIVAAWLVIGFVRTS